MSKKAVVVDDDQKTVMMAETVLTAMGYQVFTATEGKKALDLLIIEKPDLLISDLLQPGIHGVELCRSARSELKLPDLKIILMSSVYNEVSYKMEMDCQADAFMVKPFSMDSMEELVQSVMGMDT